MAIRSTSFPERVLLAVGTLAALAGVAQADDFWKQKPPSEWTVEEALKLVQDSPWAKQVGSPRFRTEITVTIRLGNCRQDPSRPQSPCGTAGETLPGRQPGEPLPSEPSADHATPVYLVRWESAEPVVQAFARLEELGERLTAQFQAPPPRLPGDRYVITVKTLRPPQSGRDAVEGLDDMELRAGAWLKCGLVVVEPLEVERSGIGASAAVHFFFPRTHAGKPLLRGKRPLAEFRFGSARLTLTSKFTLDPESLH